VGLIVVQMCY